MALKRFPCDLYASVELNQVEFPWQGMVVSQLPLSEDYTAEEPCENGMWVDASKANGEIKPVSEDTTVFGLVYTTEKEYDMYHYGLKTFGRKKAGDYPRVGIFSNGDTVTTNCFSYDDEEFADEDALRAACAAWKETPLYVVPVAGEKAPKLTNTKPTDCVCYARVCKDYTMPNGEHGLKYCIEMH